MPATQGGQPFDDLSRRWHDLADRRLAYFTELHRSGRWRLYYRTKQQFAIRMLDVIQAAKVWAELAGRAPPTVTLQSLEAARAMPPSRAELATAPKPARPERVRPAA
ncbi:MAG: hypothetical protein P8Z80_10015 [Pseudolabrys sp.]|jgi:hypothetical protein